MCIVQAASSLSGQIDYSPMMNFFAINFFYSVTSHVPLEIKVVTDLGPEILPGAMRKCFGYPLTIDAEAGPLIAR